MKWDLHMHSSYSGDGEFTPKELISKAKIKGIDVIALSDHNVVSGINEMIEEGKKVGIQVIPAVECDTTFEGFSVHVIGYNINIESPYFINVKKKIDDVLMATAKQRFKMFEAYFGLNLDVDYLADLCAPDGVLAPGINHMLNDIRHKDVEAFQPYLKGGEKFDSRTVHFYWEFCFKGAPCYLDVEYPSLEETVSEIHKAGGLAVLAHPWKTFYQREDLLKQAIDFGIDGIEAYSNYHDAKQNEYYETYCKEYDILMTCGSDFHGKMKPSIEIGEYGYSKDKQDDMIHTFLDKLNCSKKRGSLKSGVVE